MHITEHLKFAEEFTSLLDDKFSIFGFKFGLDPLIDLVPVIGDIIGAGLSLYLVWIGLQMEMPGIHIARMLINIALDFLIGFVPIIGNIGDVAFKANRRNLQILKDFEFKPGNVLEGEMA